MVLLSLKVGVFFRARGFSAEEVSAAPESHASVDALPRGDRRTAISTNCQGPAVHSFGRADVAPGQVEQISDPQLDQKQAQPQPTCRRSSSPSPSSASASTASAIARDASTAAFVNFIPPPPFSPFPAPRPPLPPLPPTSSSGGGGGSGSRGGDGGGEDDDRDAGHPPKHLRRTAVFGGFEEKFQ